MSWCKHYCRTAGKACFHLIHNQFSETSMYKCTLFRVGRETCWVLNTVINSLLLSQKKTALKVALNWSGTSSSALSMWTILNHFQNLVTPISMASVRILLGVASPRQQQQAKPTVLQPEKKAKMAVFTPLRMITAEPIRAKYIPQAQNSSYRIVSDWRYWEISFSYVSRVSPTSWSDTLSSTLRMNQTEPATPAQPVVESFLKRIIICVIIIEKLKEWFNLS